MVQESLFRGQVSMTVEEMKRHKQSCATSVLPPCQSSPSYLSEMSACHQRAADYMVEGAVRNGGLYIKLGQGLCAFNHLLPPEYIRTLQVLEDQALNRRYKEVSSGAQTGHPVLQERGLMCTSGTGGRSLPGGLQQNPRAAFQDLQLRAHRSGQLGSGSQG